MSDRSSIPPPVSKLLARRAGVAVDCAAKLADLARRILETNRTLNLTGDRTPETFWPRHVEDSLLAAERLESALGGPPAPGARVLDVGSGAGLPGLVWAILWPQATVALLESRRKKTDFLSMTAASLDLANVQVLTGRAETLAHDAALRESFDLAVARALAPLPVLAELTLPFVHPGGSVAAVKTAGIDEEIRASQRAIETLGGETAPPAQLPYRRSDDKSCIVVLIRKIRPTPGPYPRPEGIPERRPL